MLAPMASLALMPTLSRCLGELALESAAGVCCSLGVRAMAGESKVCIPDFIFVIVKGVVRFGT